MSLEKAKNYLKKYNLDQNIMEFSESTATVKEATIALQVTEAEIAKSLSFLVNNEPVLIVTSGDQKIDNAKFKCEFHTKAKMIPASEVEALIGHNVGGVCPFGIQKEVKVYLDCSLKRFPFVYPACGSSNSAIKLTPVELEKIIPGVKWIDVCQTPSPMF